MRQPAVQKWKGIEAPDDPTRDMGRTCFHRGEFPCGGGQRQWGSAALAQRASPPQGRQGQSHSSVLPQSPFPDCTRLVDELSEPAAALSLAHIFSVSTEECELPCLFSHRLHSSTRCFLQN
eukprot:8260148-Pyramimonas_sp.AAC.1